MSNILGMRKEARANDFVRAIALLRMSLHTHAQIKLRN